MSKRDDEGDVRVGDDEGYDRDDRVGGDDSLEDKELICRDCEKPFTFTQGEQEFFREKKFEGQPSRCRDCRQAKKSRMNEGGGGGYSGGGGGYNDRGYSGGGGGYSGGGGGRSGVCYDFQEGRCSRGDSCRFSHDSAGGGGGGGYRSGGGGGYSSGGGGGYSGGGGGYGGGYNNGGGGGYSGGGAKPVCYGYQEGNCRYGDSCRFSHEGAGSGGGGGYSGGGDRGGRAGGYGFGGDRGGGGSASGGRGGGSGGPCYAFQQGNCRYGDSCRFSHN